MKIFWAINAIICFSVAVLDINLGNYLLSVVFFGLAALNYYNMLEVDRKRARKRVMERGIRELDRKFQHLPRVRAEDATRQATKSNTESSD